jgi:hypothetical protein
MRPPPDPRRRRRHRWDLLLDRQGDRVARPGVDLDHIPPQFVLLQEIDPRIKRIALQIVDDDLVTRAPTPDSTETSRSCVSGRGLRNRWANIVIAAAHSYR